MKLRVFPKGTVVCTCSCTMGTTAIVGQPLITNQTFIGLVPRDERLVSEYLYWALQAYRDDLNAQATGAIQQYLSRDDFRQLRIPIPPVDEQRAIADYLDAETARIDALVAKKQRLVHLLEERQRIEVETEDSTPRPGTRARSVEALRRADHSRHRDHPCEVVRRSWCTSGTRPERVCRPY